MKMQGLTLVELMVTLAIAAIVLTLAAPTFQGTIDRNRSASHTNEFLSSLYLARSEAVTRGQRVVLCESNTGTGCTATAWDQGWIVFADDDNDAVVDAGEVIILVHGTLDGGNTLTDNFGQSYISFTNEGNAETTSGALQIGTFTFSLCVSSEQTTIAINAAGRSRVIKISC